MRTRRVQIALPLLLGLLAPAPVAQAGVVHAVVAYLPNRVLDVLDLVRLWARVGPGASISLRATEAADFSFGSYTTLYAGLPGPRGRHVPRLPVGVESRAGIEVGLADVSTGGGTGPDYSNTEIGIGLHAMLLGVDAGFDPAEIVDLVGGLLFLDPAGDDF